ncbi:facilitated trehalose transporter Tret1 [Tribolium castaneum]|uniref:facilitated trehalose transporter Tret1 n=1 Tax=Tribolium castaneum TaxID=7070 RepID=UPI0030FEB712
MIMQKKQQTGLRHMFAGTGPQILASVAATISAMNDGMHYGWSAPVIPILQADNTPIQISKVDESWLEAMYLVGGIAGLPVTIFLVNKIGRKNSTMVSSVTSLLSWILIALASNVTLLYVARFLSGLAGDMAFVATPMYVAEIADQKIRGLLSCLIYLMMLFGILLIYAIAPFTPFYVPSVVGGALLVTQLASFTFMPKSPYYLITKNKMDKARKALNRLRTTKDNEAELEEISRAIERQRKEKGRPQDLLLVNSNRKALIVITMLNGAQHFTGISVMLMNMHTILTKAGSVYLTSNATAIIFSSCMLIAATISSFAVDKYGRKFLLISSSILTGICLLVLAVYFNLQYSGYDVRAVSWIPIGCVMAYAATFKMGLGMVPIVISAEIFSNKVKAMGMTIADAMYLVFGILSIELYKHLSESYGYHVPFYIFACFSFITTVFVVTIVPETKGKSLEEIQLLLKGQKAVVSHEDKDVTTSLTKV